MVEHGRPEPEKHTVKSAPPVLAKASASGDAFVQQLVAQREIHLANGDGDKASELDRQLAQLGFCV